MAKIIDNAVVGIKVFMQWQYFKVHNMLLKKYLRLGMMRLLKRKRKSSTSILQ